MKNRKWIKQVDIERPTQVKWSSLSTMLNMSCTVLSNRAHSAYTIYLLRAMGYECKATQNLKLGDASFKPRVLNKEMKAWKAKLRDSFRVDTIPSANMTMEELHGDVFSMEENAPIPSHSN